MEKLKSLRQDKDHVKEQQNLAKRNQSSDDKKSKLQSFFDEIKADEDALIEKAKK